MAAAEVASRAQDRPNKRRPFAAWVKRLTNLKGGEQNGNNAHAKKSGSGAAGAKQKKSGPFKNNPYPESGFTRRQSPRSSRDDHSLAVSQAQNDDQGSIVSHPRDRDGRSAAPTLATNAETIHSDAGHSKAFTTTTGGGGFSSIAGNNSTFSSPNESQQSLTTTLTTIQSSSPGNTLQNGASSSTPNPQGGPVMFSHQYPVSPAPSTLNAVSAIPRHLTSDRDRPSDSNSNVLTDDASILTLASSSKRRRRSMDTDASVRALAPNSVWGGSRESLPLSVLSGNNADSAANTTGLYYASQSRPSIGGFASAERASVYSSQGVAAPALASERNSYYAAAQRPGNKDYSDAKSLRSLNQPDSRSQYDARSMTDARSLHNINPDSRSLHDGRMDGHSLRNYEGSIRSGALGHGRNGSFTGSIGSPLASPGLRHASTSGALSRRSSDWNRDRGEDADAEEAGAGRREEGEEKV